jgi:hypothetical protein
MHVPCKYCTVLQKIKHSACLRRNKCKFKHLQQESHSVDYCNFKRKKTVVINREIAGYIGNMQVVIVLDAS